MTTFAAIFRGASALVMLSGLACAQDAMTILKHVGETYSALRSYEFQGTTSSVTQTGKITSTSDESFSVTFSAPDHFFVEFRYPGQGSWTRASNGTTMTEIRTAIKEFDRRPATQYDIRVLDNSPIGAFYEMEKGVNSATVEGSEKLTVEGQEVDCWVIQADRQVGILPGGVQRLPTKLWIDKARSLVLKQVSGTESIEKGSKATKNERTMTITLAHLSQPISPEVFEPRGGKKK